MKVGNGNFQNQCFQASEMIQIYPKDLSNANQIIKIQPKSLSLKLVSKITKMKIHERGSFDFQISVNLRDTNIILHSNELLCNDFKHNTIESKFEFSQSKYKKSGDFEVIMGLVWFLTWQGIG